MSVDMIQDRLNVKWHSTSEINVKQHCIDEIEGARWSRDQIA